MKETIDIYTGDLLCLEAGERNVEGWYVVTDMSGLGITLNSLKHRRHVFTLPKKRGCQILRHIRAEAVPGAIEALQQIASGKLIVEGEERDAPELLQKTLGVNAQRVKDIYLVGPDNSALFAVIAVRMASDALCAVRGEESA